MGVGGVGIGFLVCSVFLVFFTLIGCDRSEFSFRTW